MYYQNYEDYMRLVLGYPIENKDIYQMNHIDNIQDCHTPNQYTKELEDCYPEVYKIINPIVCEICDKYNKPVTKNMLENMIEEVYHKIEINNEILVKINIDNHSNENKVENRINNNIRRNQEVENRQRRDNNQFLRDLIRILILNRLLGENFPNRPPYQRPPFPGGPRPPMNREYEDYFKF